QDETLSQQLPDHAESSGTHAQAYRYLAPARGRSREHKIGDIGARNRVDQGHHGQQHEQRLGVLATQTVEAAGTFLDEQRGKICALLIRGSGSNPLLEARRQNGLGSSEGNSGTETSHYFDPVVVLIQIFLRSEAVE